MVEKSYLEFGRILGGLNYGPTRCALEAIDLANGWNFDLQPMGGVRKRSGTAVQIQPTYDVADVEVDYADDGHLDLAYWWEAPGGSRHLLFIHTDPDLGLVRPYTATAMKSVPAGTYLDVEGEG